jgi:uncharacterized delta-60 repeat protein
MTVSRIAIPLLCLAAWCTAPAHAQTPGTLDPTFGTNVITTHAFGKLHVGYRLAADANGRWLVGSRALLPNDQTKTPKSRATVTRFTSEGNVDTTFGADGLAIAPLDFLALSTVSVVRDVNRVYLVAAGKLPGDSVYAHVAVFAFKHNGTLDTAWGNAGKRVVDTGADNWNIDLALQGTKLLVAARGGSGDGTTKPMLLRLNGEGQPDTTFGVQGIRYYDAPPGQPDFALNFDRILVMPDQRVLLSARARQPSSETDLMVMRLQASGAPDTTFGAMGATILDIQGNEEPGGIARMADGRVVVAATSCEGAWNATSFCDLAVARLREDGQPDTTFGNHGVALHHLLPLSVPGEWGNLPCAVSVDAQGRAIVGGVQNDLASALLVRLRSDGSLDPTFGNGGIVLDAYRENTGGTGAIHDVAPVATPAGPRLVSVGYFAPIGGGIRLAIARHIAGE